MAHIQWPPVAHDGRQRIDLHGPIVTFEEFDSHFLLPILDSPEVFDTHPASPWLFDWWDFATPGQELWIYCDGSAQKIEGRQWASTAAAVLDYFLSVDNGMKVHVDYKACTTTSPSPTDGGGTLTIFALQETRLRRLNQSYSDDYFLFRACATEQGHFGISVWHCEAPPICYRGGPHMRSLISIDFPAPEMEPESAHVASAVSVP